MTSSGSSRATSRSDGYSPERRTALILTGTGADGVYHAGVLRALYESGIKIDLVGGRGIGAVSAILTAVDGGPRLAWLERIRTAHPISLHGVALSLAAAAPPEPRHLERLAALVDRIEPALVSEHLAWSTWGGAYRPDLLPVPRSREVLQRVIDNISRVQLRLKRRIALENPSHYLRFDDHSYGEVEFLVEIARGSGCALLFDVNNVHVSANNMQLVQLIQNRSHTCERPRPGAAWKACTTWNKVFAPAAIAAPNWPDESRDRDPNFHDGWQPIRLRQPAQDAE